MILYIEQLSFFSLMPLLFRTAKAEKIYYIHATKLGLYGIKIFKRFVSLDISPCIFKMMQVRDSSGEIIRQRHSRKDIREVTSSIVEDIRKNNTKHNVPHHYVRRSLNGSVSVLERHNISRVIYLVDVVAWHLKKHHPYNEGALIAYRRPFKRHIEAYALKRNITVNALPWGVGLSGNAYEKKQSFIFRFPKLKHLLSALKHLSCNKNQRSKQQQTSNHAKILFNMRGDLSLDSDGHHSDFFAYLNSDLSINNMMVDLRNVNDDVVIGLKSRGISPFNRHLMFLDVFRNKEKYSIYGSTRSEQKHLSKLSKSYALSFKRHEKLYAKNNVRIDYDWFKYAADHAIKKNVLEKNNGIYALQQLMFDGYENEECIFESDVYFAFSNFSFEIDKKIKSKCPYYIITGYPRDYAKHHLEQEAKMIRQQLKANGANYIVAVFDENSNQDERWHTGHSLQEENYRYILELLLKEDNVGVIFKPKVARTLRSRLPKINPLLDTALQTGRCYIFEETITHTTKASPLVAGLAADISIHGHLSAGTVGLECAVHGLPCLLIDREGSKSKLNELPKGKVVFDDWPQCIDALLTHLKSKKGIEGFGDWSSIVNDLDPFQDGLAAKRIGTYLNWMIKDFDAGFDREDILKRAAKRYAEAWGSDKVLCLN
ncbi:MAG: hypothetical protein P8L77_05415, partial [Gammaproteobacteria bacterium]|nr:hypothetical protein [Gammaproteobacteria bacterium]